MPKNKRFIFIGTEGVFNMHDELKNNRNKELKYLERTRRVIRRRVRLDESRDMRFKLGLSSEWELRR